MHSATFAFLLAAPLLSVLAQDFPTTCLTHYANRPRTTVYTSFYTDTTNIIQSTFINSTTTLPTPTETEYPSTTLAVESITSTFTHYTTVAPTTVTVSAEPGFIPLTSATTTSIPPSDDDKRKRAAAGTPPSSYVVQVICPTTVTHSFTETYYAGDSVPPTVTVTAATPSTATSIHTVVITSTSTVSTSTATAFDECHDANNVLHAYHGTPINFVRAVYIDEDVGNVPGGDDWVRAAQQSPRDCCNAAYVNGYTAFVYTGPHGDAAQCRGVSWPGGVDPNFVAPGVIFFTEASNNTGRDHTRWYAGNLGPGVDSAYAGSCSDPEDYCVVFNDS